MEIIFSISIWDIFAIIFYVLLAIYLFFKIKNIILIKKLNCKEEVKEIKKQLKNKKFIKVIKAMLITTLLAAVGIIPITFFFLITIYPLIKVIAVSKKSAFADFDIVIFLFNFFCVIIYVIVFLFLAKAIYINININKILKNKK